MNGNACEIIENDWKINGDKEASFNETIEFLLDITQQNFDTSLLFLRACTYNRRIIVIIII